MAAIAGDAERTLVGYSIGKWVDETGDGKCTRSKSRPDSSGAARL